MGADGDVASGRAFVAASAGALFGKAHALAEEVHLAMVSRGYTGNARTLDHGPGSRRLDITWVAGCVAVVVAAIGADRAIGR